LEDFLAFSPRLPLSQFHKVKVTAQHFLLLSLTDAVHILNKRTTTSYYVRIFQGMSFRRFCSESKCVYDGLH